jgi:hypothetical protein
MEYFWYEREPELYEVEYNTMKKQFPQFEIYQMQDGSGRLYWRGKVQPGGPDGAVWELMLIYKNTHPQAEGYGGSIQILPVSPNLRDLVETFDLTIDSSRGLGLGLPHIYRQNFGRREEYFICTADPQYFKTNGVTEIGGSVTTAASACAWACKWIMLVEMWLNGDIGDELAIEGMY